MKNNKLYIIGILALAIGLLLGWFLFKESPTSSKTQHDINNHETVNAIWTCSMHPQIRQDEPGDCPICGMDLIPATQSSIVDSNGFQMTAEAIKLANIQTTIIGGSSTANGTLLKLNGKMQADETRSASMVTHIPGRIERLFVSFTGEEVSRGQKIATIYSPELITAQKELIEAQKIEDISPGLLNAAKNKLRYWKISNEVIDNVLSTGTIREVFNIYADHSGIVSQKHVSVGDYLSTGEVLFDVQNLNKLWALFDVYEKDLSQVSVGSKINFTTPSISSQTFKATITFIDPVINPQTRVATIRAEVSNSGKKLKPEMFISGEINITEKSVNITVPKTAVLWTGLRSVVYVKQPNVEIPSFEYREVEIGEIIQNNYTIMSGLELGEEVVTNGAFVIDASAQLNNRASMMNKKVWSKNVSHSNHLPDYTSSTPIEFKEQLSKIAKAYLPLKDALVASDQMLAVSASEQLLNELGKVDMQLVKDEAHIYWMEQLTTLQAHGTKIKEHMDIEGQRKQFDFLSQALIKSIKVFGITNDTFYIQHCPMVNDNDGADWLSMESEIRNPYFGDVMLTCGTVHDTIDQHFKNPQLQIQSTSNQNQLHNH